MLLWLLEERIGKTVAEAVFLDKEQPEAFVVSVYLTHL